MAMYNEITVTAELTNTEYMITKNYNLLENKPQINSVELMGNKSLEDLGINPDAEENVIDIVKVNGSALTPDANKAVNVTVTTGSDNGTVKVNGSDVAVKGLKSAAFTEATAYDAAGSAAEVQGNVDALTVVVDGKVDKVQGKGLSQNDFTNAYKSKLDGIEAGAQVNTVTSVAGKTGAVTLQKSDVGLGNVDNTSDLNKPISTATQTALNGKVDKVAGKGLSQNDFTNELKSKLDGIESGAEVNVQADWNQTDSSSDDYIKNKPSLVGEVPDLISGGSLSLVTPEITQNAPYIFRQTAGGLNNLFPLMNLKSIVGGSVVWNQIIADNHKSGTKSGSGWVRSNDFSLTENHKYLLVRSGKYSDNVNSCRIASTSPSTILYGVCSPQGGSYQAYIFNCTESRSNYFIQAYEVDAAQYDFYLNLFDLTQMFNSTIADYVLSLETSQAGSGIAWLKKYGYFTKPYYAYSANTIQSVKVSAKKVVGFNQWDEEWEVGSIDDSTGQNTTTTNTIRSKNYIPVIAGQSYYCKTANSTMRVFLYDSNKAFISPYYDKSNSAIIIPNEVAYIRFRMYAAYGTTYNHDICINLAWDNSRNGEYEPYTSTTYDLSGSHLVNRKYEYRAYESGDESLPDTITDGTNTVTKLDTPTTETVTNPTLRGIPKLDANNNLYYDGDSFSDFQNLQIVDDFGTEEFVDNRDVPIPVGNESVYRQEIELPALPTTDGNYNLQFTKSASGVTTSFVSTS